MAANMANPAVKFIKYWFPAIIYGILIFYFSSVPGESVPVLFIYQDVVFHIIEYAIFAFLISRALKAYNPGMNYRPRFLWVVCAVIIYALSDELHQYFVSGRSASFIDVFYDGLGAVIINIFYK